MNRREILFRGKRVDNGEWVFGGVTSCSHTVDGKTYIVSNIYFEGREDEEDFELIEVDPSTVGQLHNTLTRKAGSKVFVGDIIRHDLEEGLGQPKRIGETSTVNSVEFDYAYYTNVSVVGNTHDTHLTQK